MCTLVSVMSPDAGAGGGDGGDGGAAEGGMDSGSAMTSMYQCSNGCVGATPTRCGDLCVDNNTDPRHCGMCGHTCPGGTNASPACMNGNCILECGTGTGNCDGNAANGCETSTVSNIMHCGRCGNACLSGPGATAVCRMGTCDLMCAAGSNNCDLLSSNGCESNPLTDVRNCGGCGTDCLMRAPANSTGNCTAGVCGFTCSAGYTLMAGACVLTPPQQVAPMSGSTVNRHRPTFRVSLGSGANSVEVQVCRDRACTMVVATFTGMGTSAVPPTDLMAGVYFWRARGLSSSTMMPVTSYSYVWQFHVPVTLREPAGGPSTSWGMDHDLDGDGLSDGVVGAYDFPVGGPGLVYIFAGQRTGGVVPTSPSTTVNAPAGAGHFGYSLTAVGDVDGDGFGDVASLDASSRRVYLLRGAATRYVNATVNSYPMPAGATNFGTVIAGLGDVDGDGFSDTAITSMGASGPVVWIFRGSATGPLAGTQLTLPAGLSYGTSVVGAGDVNGDGLADLAVGGPLAGQVLLFHGTSGGASPLVVAGPAVGPTGMNFGSSLASGDVNGDGYSDLLVGANTAGAAGGFFLCRGSATGITTCGTLLPLAAPSGGTLGSVAVGVGDLNADGYADFVAGSPSSRQIVILTGNSTSLGMLPPGAADPAANYGALLGGGGADYNGDNAADFSVGVGIAMRSAFFAGSTTPGATTFGTTSVALPASSFGTAIASRRARSRARWN